MKYVIIHGTPAEIRSEVRRLLGKDLARLIRSYNPTWGKLVYIRSFFFATDDIELVVVDNTAVVRFA